MSDTIKNWEELLGADDSGFVEYATVPLGKGKEARLGSLSGEAILEWLEDNNDPEKAKTNGLVLVAKCLVDSDGNRIGNVSDVTKLRNKQPRTVRALVEAAIRLNSLVIKDVPPNAPTSGDSSIASPSPQAA